MYSDLLVHELEKTGETAPRSIALTGPYGSGKSSVIDNVKNHFGKRAISVSLPTLGDGVIDEKRDSASSTTASRMSKTNVVQKEIVKQLLYIEKPSKMRGSRFQRITPMNWGLAIVTAAAVSITGTIVIFSSNALTPVVKLFPENGVAVWVVHLAALTSLAGLVLVLFSLLHSKISLSEVGSGSASIKLTGANTNYFDEYLDEVVYFFERTKVDIVVFEDLDRFNEPHIFETLKELNTLLNGSKQLRRKKTIRFVYAIRDSIFDLRQTPDVTDVGDGSERAKFFGAIVPLVPFITHRSSAALLIEVLGQNAPTSSVLIEAVAAHLTDMRLIKNIRNEWEIFRRRILSDDGLTGLDADKLFAMVVYKNIRPADFERIRSASSLLDIAFRAATDLVRQNSKRLADNASGLRNRANVESAESTASRLGEELQTTISLMSSRFGQSAAHEYQISGVTLLPGALKSLAFWQGLATAGATLTVLHVAYRNYGQQVVTAEFTGSEIARLLACDIDPNNWERTSAEDLRRLATEADDERGSLESMSFGDLLRASSRPTVRLSVGDRKLLPNYVEIDTAPMSLDILVAALFNDDAAVLDLLRAELIDLNFTLYTSEFRDAKISASAMTYFIQFVQKNESNLVYKFKNRDDIQALVEYAGITALEGRAFYNVEIVDYLLTGGENMTPVEGIDYLTSTLASGTPVDREFIAEFLERSDNAGALIREMAQFDRDLFEWLEITFANDRRLSEFFSAALSGATNRPYSTSSRLRARLAELAPAIPALVQSISVPAALTITTALQRLGVEITDLAALGTKQRTAIIEKHLFELSEANLRLALPGNDLSLEQIRNDDPALAEFALANLEKYLKVVSESGGGIVSIRDPDRFLEVLNWANEGSPLNVQQVAELASASCSARDLDEVEEPLWAPLARSGRIHPTLTNVQNIREGIDRGIATTSDLERWLADTPQIEIDADDQPFAVELRTLLLRSVAIPPARKVTLIASLGLDNPLNATDIEPDDSDLFARLTEVGLLPDTAETFTHLSGYPYARASFIALSSSFAAFMPDVQLELSDIRAIVHDTAIGDDVRQALLQTVGSLARGDKAVAKDLLQFAHSHRANVQSEILLKSLELGVARELVIDLIPININNRSGNSLNALLTALGGEYAKLAVPGYGVAKLADDTSHRLIVGRLQRVGFAGKISAVSSPTGKIVVSRRRSAGSNN